MDKEQCLQLIQLYEEYRHLWNTRCPDYTNRGLREEAWKNIVKQLNIPVLDLKKKMESLLGSYRREKSREKKNRARGPGRGETYKSNWYAYEAFKFLGDRNYKTLDNLNKNHAIQNDDSESILDNEETDNETKNESIEFLIVEEQDKSTRTKKRAKRSNDLTNNTVSGTQKSASGNTETKADSYEVFGQYVANELRKYDAFTLAHVKRAISEVIFEADTGTYQSTASHSSNYISHPSTSIPSTSPMPSVSPMSNEMESCYLTTVKLSPPHHSN